MKQLGSRNIFPTYKLTQKVYLPATTPMVMYISVMVLVKAVVIVPRLIRNPPNMTTGR